MRHWGRGPGPDRVAGRTTWQRCRRKPVAVVDLPERSGSPPIGRPGWIRPSAMRWLPMVCSSCGGTQAQAAQAAWDGRHVVLSTGTASGKSVAYWLPALTAAVAGGNTLYCTRPRHWPPTSRPGWMRSAYRGSTPRALRRATPTPRSALDPAQQPVHPHQPRTCCTAASCRGTRNGIHFLARLRLWCSTKVICTAGFGANVSAVITRLRGSARRPVLIRCSWCSATLEQPADAAAVSMGGSVYRDVTAVTRDRSASAGRTRHPARFCRGSAMPPTNRLARSPTRARALTAWVRDEVRSVISSDPAPGSKRWHRGIGRARVVGIASRGIAAGCCCPKNGATSSAGCGWSGELPVCRLHQRVGTRRRHRRIGAAMCGWPGTPGCRSCNNWGGRRRRGTGGGPCWPRRRIPRPLPSVTRNGSSMPRSGRRCSTGTTRSSCWDM